MSPESTKLALFVVQEAIKAEPAIAKAISDMFSKGIPTEADWANLRASVDDNAYMDYVPDSALPASETGK
jgi:hypothetical protein